MAHLKGNKEANLVIGAVLLIAVMVIVSVAVDAWTGKTAYSSQIEELTISSFAFSSNNTINMVVENNGTISSGITEIWINNEKQTFTANSTTIPTKDCIDLLIIYPYSNSTNYHFKLVSDRGNTYLFTAIAL